MLEVFITSMSPSSLKCPWGTLLGQEQPTLAVPTQGLACRAWYTALWGQTKGLSPSILPLTVTIEIWGLKTFIMEGSRFLWSNKHLYFLLNKTLFISCLGLLKQRTK